MENVTHIFCELTCRLLTREMEKLDLIVIGSGSGLDVANQGWKVTVIEEGPMGAPCLNGCCIPSKVLIHCADVIETTRTSGMSGIEVTSYKLAKESQGVVPHSCP